MKKYLLLITSLIVTLSFAGQAHAYSCWADDDVAKKIAGSDVIFLGKIKSIIDVGSSKTELQTDRYNIYFEISKVWKGIEDEVELIFADTELFYDYDFKVGEAYLVYGYKIYKNRISIIGCPRVKRIEQAQGDLKFLGKSLYESQKVEIIATAKKPANEEKSEEDSDDVKEEDLISLEAGLENAVLKITPEVTTSQKPANKAPIAAQPAPAASSAPAIIEPKEEMPFDDIFGDLGSDDEGEFGQPAQKAPAPKPAIKRRNIDMPPDFNPADY